MAVAIEISDRCQVPASWKSRARCSTDENVVVEIPYRCLMGAGFVKHIVRVSIAVKVRCRHEFPARGQ